MNDELILPSQIPWESIKAKDLEELTYWLLESMGAKDIEWRIGGSGAGTADQGRDIECSFYSSLPDGELVKQKWWVDAKGRSKTVSPTDVKETVLNATAYDDVDVLLIVTNSYFSNPTRDWVKKNQLKHPLPKVKLWERTELEKYCSKNPMAVIRLFTDALSPQGKLEVIRSKLWNYAVFTDEPTLIDLWKHRQQISITPESLFPLIVSECANGNIARRSWAVFVDDDIALYSLLTFIMNFYVLVYKAIELGVKQKPYIKAASYLILCCIDMYGAEKMNNIFKDWSSFDKEDWDNDDKEFILTPILNLLTNELRDVCMEDCERVMGDRYDLEDDEVKDYWKRLGMGGNHVYEEDNESVLSLEKNDAPCKVGFCVNKDVGCPVNDFELDKSFNHLFDDIEQVIKHRK